MRILKHLENSFINSSFKVKVELYLLVFILFSLIIYNIPLLFNNDKTLTKSISYKIEEFDKSLLDMNKNIEEYTSVKRIKINSMNNERKEILINCTLSLNKIKDFVSFLENINTYSNIKNLSIDKNKQSKKYNLEITVSFEKYFFKTPNSKETVKKSKSKKFKLKAIIDKTVLINNKWLELGEYISDYELIVISKNSVTLSFDDKKIKLKVYKNDKYQEY
ncbi:hypothetical protein [Poseidonibacter lekithochrous]|uniref:hypothetical protein n=1 Tax=Poseidonibacter lekithochrous TaxID=1904463 RepID=UPI000A452D69|nr:hypothetical protein [Poseidonibacter lekithochrous]